MTAEVAWSWVACACVLLGIWLITNRKLSGFIVVSIGAAITGVLVFINGQWGIVAQEIFVIAINLRGGWQWRKEKLHDREDKKIRR